MNTHSHHFTAPHAITVSRRSTDRQRKIRFSTDTSNAALRAAIEALAVEIAAEEPLGEAHDAAEEAGRALAVGGGGRAEIEKAERAAEAADRRWQRQRGRVDAAAAALLEVAVDNPADALVQQKAYRWSYKERGIRDIWDIYEAEACLKAALRALARFSEISQTSAARAAACDAAREAFLMAKATYDAMEDQESVEGQEAFLQLTRVQLAYVQTPPADVSQLRTQMKDAINFDGLPGFGEDVDDPAVIQKLLDADEAPINYLAVAYQHVQRLAGSEGRILDARRALPTGRGETDAEFMNRLNPTSQQLHAAE